MKYSDTVTRKLVVGPDGFARYEIDASTITGDQEDLAYHRESLGVVDPVNRVFVEERRDQQFYGIEHDPQKYSDPPVEKIRLPDGMDGITIRAYEELEARSFDRAPNSPILIESEIQQRVIAHDEHALERGDWLQFSRNQSSYYALEGENGEMIPLATHRTALGISPDGRIEAERHLVPEIPSLATLVLRELEEVKLMLPDEERERARVIGPVVYIPESQEQPGRVLLSTEEGLEEAFTVRGKTLTPSEASPSKGGPELEL